ncbi:DNA-binding transcriptional regulator, MerR family [Streptomyces zhaozhouensis]|uniref:DNA-binding transcriptional regulator, MerR family n=1 Tax=Streptomyces zhaozhouensis TaxID=1300267 RepID=A0A286DNQ8_9ACTN|nr:MerR family transcriptional regulator [Streptomyces zhaozhouensis]SOD60338.1 DNA-binding transcriptional regulator, MerR family [Streptomyces zhaozhouensis]
MAWSTRQLAELAGTTVKAVRHYHSIGLLEVPERASNGYKQYQVAHLVRLLQIKRLSDLGMSLSQIAALGHPDQRPDEAIRELDAELAATIDRLQRVREELASLLRHRAPMDVPNGFGEVADQLTETDRAMLLIYSQVFTDDVMGDLLESVRQPRAHDAEFDTLSADADAATIERLAVLMAPEIRAQQENYPRLDVVGAGGAGGPERARSTVAQALVELYNPAQLKVLYRADQIIRREDGADGG